MAAAFFVVLSCGRFGYESLRQGLPDLELSDGDAAGVGDSTGSGAIPGSASASAGGTGSAGGGSSAGSGGDTAGVGGGSYADAGDSGGGPGVDADAGGAVGTAGAGGAASTCGPGVSAATWGFASDTEGWQISVDTGATGNMSWTAATGDPAPGALQLDVTVNGTGVRTYLDQNLGDLTGKIIYARVFLESGSGMSAKVYVQMGAGLAWADGYSVSLNAQEWNCVAIDLQDPDYSDASFDPTGIRRIGVMLFGNASSRLYVDQVTY